MSDELESKKRHRSPAYPVIALHEAIDRLTRFYTAQKTRSFVGMDAAVESMGYSPKSSLSPRAVAAMVAYGLLEDDGSGKGRKLKVTDLGYRIVVLESSDPRRSDAIREAAMKPKIVTDLVGQWPDGLPTDSAIRSYLILERNFNPDAVPGVIQVFRATYEFAGLQSHARLSDEESDMNSPATHLEPERFVPPPINVRSDGPPPHQGSVVTTQTPTENSELRRHTIPIPGDRQAYLQVPAGLTESDYAFLQRYLDLMKGAIVGKVPDQPKNPD